MVHPTCRAECTPWLWLGCPKQRGPGSPRERARTARRLRGRRHEGIPAATDRRTGGHRDFASGAWPDSGASASRRAYVARNMLPKLPRREPGVEDCEVALESLMAMRRT